MEKEIEAFGHLMDLLYLKHGHYGPQEGVEVFTVATRRLVAGFATKFAAEQIHAQNAVAIGRKMKKKNEDKQKKNIKENTNINST